MIPCLHTYYRLAHSLNKLRTGHSLLYQLDSVGLKLQKDLLDGHTLEVSYMEKKLTHTIASLKRDDDDAFSVSDSLGKSLPVTSFVVCMLRDFLWMNLRTSLTTSSSLLQRQLRSSTAILWLVHSI